MRHENEALRDQLTSPTGTEDNDIETVKTLKVLNTLLHNKWISSRT